MECVQLLSVLLLFEVVNQSEALKCYACGETNIFIGQHYTSPPSCDEFERSNAGELSRFVIECPDEYVGCLTQTQGNHVLRTCDILAIDDCQTANGVTYCYCNSELCNSQGKGTPAPTLNVPDHHIDDELSDDEDYISEMSGFGPADDATTTTTEEPVTFPDITSEIIVTDSSHRVLNVTEILERITTTTISPKIGSGFNGCNRCSIPIISILSLLILTNLLI